MLVAAGRCGAAALRYVRSLAGLPPSSSSSAAAQDDDGGAAALQRLLDALRDSPAFALDGHWNVVGWNADQEQLYPASPGARRSAATSAPRPHRPRGARTADRWPEFADGWGRHDVGGLVTRERVFHRPSWGCVR
ncbi:MmyB family transcriptional regulator [Quadrisphaera oryzae]|uniref:MmyB family transcriptional regulator n=1 Tax=Quadrisphaera TaxID=317661 RepID=UPI0016476073|nr:hypothetical protein [Quadrisphaera sp. RL12-1S]